MKMLISSGALLILASISLPAATMAQSSWYNVKSYGATGNGTADDTAAIQAAINAIPNSGALRGGVLYFPIGKYKIAGVSFGDRRSVRVVGDTGASFNEANGFENGTQILVSVDGGVGFSFDGGPSIPNYWGPVIEHLAFSDVSPRGQTATLLSIVNTTHWTVRNCAFRNAAVGIKIATNRPVYPTGDNAFALVEQGTFRNNRRSIYVPHTFGVLILGGAINMLPDAVGILADDGQAIRIVGLQTFGGTGVDLAGSYNTVADSFFESSPVVIRGNTSHPSATGQANKVIGCHVSGTGVETGITVGKGATKTRIVACSFLNLAHEVADYGSETIILGQ
jgi:hypothetical protein